MDVNGIMDMSRTLTHSNDTQVPNATAIDYLNIVYSKVASRIISEIDEDFFWDEFLTDSVASQNEYVMAIPTATTVWMKKIQRVEIKWASNDSYKSLVNSDTISNYNDSTGDLNANLGISNAFYEVKDGSVFVYPNTTEVITDAVKIQATVTLIDLVIWWTATTIFPNSQDLREYHYLLATWMKQFIYGNKWLINEKNDSINEFETELNRVINSLKDRLTWPVVSELPYTSLSI